MELRNCLLESAEVGGQQRLIQRRVGGLRRLHEGNVDLQMPARDLGFDRLAQRRFEGIELRRQMEMQIERPMVHALQAENDFALGNRFSYSGEARHAPDAHWSTIASN